MEFPYAFLEAFGNKETTIKRLRSGASNKSELGGVLQTNNIHIAVCAPGDVTKTLAALKASPATARAKAKFVLATDGDSLEAEDLASGETIACAYANFPDHFGFFLPLAGITTVTQIRESALDIKATGRLSLIERVANCTLASSALKKLSAEPGAAEKTPIEALLNLSEVISRSLYGTRLNWLALANIDLRKPISGRTTYARACLV